MAKRRTFDVNTSHIIFVYKIFQYCPIDWSFDVLFLLGEAIHSIQHSRKTSNPAEHSMVNGRTFDKQWTHTMNKRRKKNKNRTADAIKTDNAKSITRTTKCTAFENNSVYGECISAKLWTFVPRTNALTTQNNAGRQWENPCILELFMPRISCAVWCIHNV